MSSEVMQVVAGAAFFVLRNKAGHVFTWGQGPAGELGRGNECQSSPGPVQVGGIPPVKMVCAGAHAAGAITVTGVPYFWGILSMLRERPCPWQGTSACAAWCLRGAQALPRTRARAQQERPSRPC